MLKRYAYDLRIYRIVSIQNTISWNYGRNVEWAVWQCECYSKQDECENICWTWRNHLSRGTGIYGRCRLFNQKSSWIACKASRLQTTVRQLRLDSSIRPTQGGWYSSYFQSNLHICIQWVCPSINIWDTPSSTLKINV